MAMNFDNWSALIPFYVAGTLSSQEKQAFESYLAGSPQARQALDEWREIAHHVYLEASQRANRLPPLAQHIRSPKITSNGHQPYHTETTMPSYIAPTITHPHRQAPTPRKPKSINPLSFMLTGAAAVVLLTIVGSIALLSMLGGNNESDEFGAAFQRNTALPSLTATPLPMGTSTTVPLNTGIATPTPNHTFIPVTVPAIGNGLITSTPLATALPPTMPASNILMTMLATPTQFPDVPASIDENQSIVLDGITQHQIEGDISTPEGDQNDVISLSLAANTLQINYAIQVICVGIDPAYAIWQLGDKAEAHPCVNTVSQTLSLDSAEQVDLLLAFAEDSPRNVIHYTVLLTPQTGLPTPTPIPAEAAPDAEVLAIPLTALYLPLQFTQDISAPFGDVQDALNISLPVGADGLPSYTYRLTLSCVGQNTQNLIWAHGLERKTYSCGDTVQADFFRRTDNYTLPMNVLFLDNTQPSYVSYTVTLQYVYEANDAYISDAEPKDILATQSGTSFGNHITAENFLDRIHVTIPDLAIGETRTLLFTLTCTGTGTESLTWTTLIGGKTNGCGSTLTAGFSNQNNKISFDIAIPEGTSADLDYTLTISTAP